MCGTGTVGSKAACTASSAGCDAKSACACPGCCTSSGGIAEWDGKECNAASTGKSLSNDTLVGVSIQERGSTLQMTVAFGDDCTV